MVVGVIPARLGSSRFPKKILAPLAGKPMVAHAIEQAQKSEKLDKVILAIDSGETKEALADFDFEIIMTDSNHISGTDRVAEVVKNIDDVEIVINIQGDEFNFPLKGIKDIISKLTSSKNKSAYTLVTRSKSSKSYNYYIVDMILSNF